MPVIEVRHSLVRRKARPLRGQEISTKRFRELTSGLDMLDGVRALDAAHPGVRCWTAAIDCRLNEGGYIIPGLGDAGDKILGSK